MTLHDGDQAPKAVRSIYPPLVLIALSVMLIVWSTGFNQTARQMPILVGAALLILSLIDLACRFDNPALGPVRDFWGADFRNREMRHNPRWTSEAAQFAWMTGCVAGMLVIGILPTVPAFVFFYMRVHGRRPLIDSLITAAVVFAFVFIVFEVFLDYRLYRGVVFDEAGFARW